MTLRDETYEKFGPLLLEGLFDAVLDEINFLRTAASLPARTKQYFLGRVHNSLAHLDDYDWMKDE